MEDEFRDILRKSSRGNMLAIWEKVKTGHVEDLRGEEKQIAEIMREHADDYREEMEAAWKDIGYEFDPESDEVNPFLHIVVHTVIENQFVIAADNIAREAWIGIPSPEIDFVPGKGILPAWGCRVGDYLTLESPKAKYLYDMGNDWLHALVLEKILGRKKGPFYPRCIKGKRACPPEDCGGIPGYYELVEAMEMPGSEEYKNCMEWLVEEYDPDLFSADEITFQDPGELLPGDR